MDNDHSSPLKKTMQLKFTVDWHLFTHCYSCIRSFISYLILYETEKLHSEARHALQSGKEMIIIITKHISLQNGNVRHEYVSSGVELIQSLLSTSVSLTSITSPVNASVPGSQPGFSNLASKLDQINPKWDKSGTQKSFSTFWLATETDLKKSQICHIWG